MAIKNNLSIRASQVIAPFGVGSLVEVEGQSFFISGTREWKTTFRPNKIALNNLKTISFPLLTDRLNKINALKQPLLSVKIFRFPLWHFCRNCRLMTKVSGWVHDQVTDDGSNDTNFINNKINKPTCSNPDCKNIDLTPMRFVAACEHGHIADIDWYWWANRRLNKAQTGSCDPRTAKLEFHEEGRGGGDFEHMHIVCSCSKKLGLGEFNNLEGINSKKLPQKCYGYHPGQRQGESKDCITNNKQTLMEMLPRGAMKLHYPLILSALDINTEDKDDKKFSSLLNDSLFKTSLKLYERSGMDGEEFYEDEKETFKDLENRHNLTKEELLTCFEDPTQFSTEPDIDGQEITQTEILEKEFPTLVSPNPVNTKNIKTIPNIIGTNDPLSMIFKKIVRVERLREVRVFKGFQRIEASNANTLVPPDLGHEDINWLPACEVFGEGIFFEFNANKLNEWYVKNKSIINDLTEEHINKANEQGLFSKKGVEPSPQFILIHTFSHLLITQLIFECGYSSTSLKERIYSNADLGHFGLLIYTSDSDSEGAMGGLTEMGDIKIMKEIIFKAVNKSRWCSNDPVCRELTKQGVMGLNGAACHACCLIAETSCDHNNILLNRLLVSGNQLINGRGKVEPKGFFQEFLDQFEGEI